jgi:hypothetical protein
MSSHTLFSVLYRDEDSPTGWTRGWFTTFAKADRFTRRHKISDSARVESHDIPKTKLGLAEWLNDRFVK